MTQPDRPGAGNPDKSSTARPDNPGANPDTLGAFFNENKTLLREYFETRMEIYRLQALRIFAKSAGYFAWIFLSLFLAFLFLLFGGLMAGFWFSNLLHSNVKGFGLVTLIIGILFVGIALFRKALFVDPVIYSVIKRSLEEEEGEEKEENKIA